MRAGTRPAGVTRPDDLPMPGATPVVLEGWHGSWTDDDPDANFKSEVALYADADPLATIRMLSANLGIPVGGLCHYVLRGGRRPGAVGSSSWVRR